MKATLEDLAISQECSHWGHKYARTAEGLREQIAGYREELKRIFDPEIRKHLLESIVRCQEGANLNDARAAIWYEESENWANGVYRDESFQQR